MIDIGITPNALVCGRATDVVIVVANRSLEHSAYAVVVEFEPDGSVRLDGGDCRIEIDELGPGAVYEHRVTLTGRAAGVGHVDLPYLSYWTDDGKAVRPPTRPLSVRVDSDAMHDRPEVKAHAVASTTPTMAPEPPLPSVFISHRHADSGWLGQHLRARLASILPGSRIFLDHDDLAPGDEWPVVIDRELERADALLALIGQKWETLVDGETGIRRILLPCDVVRHEIATALRRRILLIPILHDRAELPHADDLPRDLRSLHDHQAIGIHRRTQRHAIRDIAVRLRGTGMR